jgi:proline iminopeptidase
MLASINSTQLYFDRMGSGSAILFLHGGFGMDSSYFHPFLDPLAQDYDCVFLDVRGNGRSTSIPATEITIDHILSDFEALRRHLGIARWTVVGHSGGGLLAASYGLAHPEAVHRVILIGSFGRIPFRAPEWIAAPKRFHLPTAQQAFDQFRAGITTDAEYRAASLAIAPLFFADPATADLRLFQNIQFRVVPFNAMFDNHGVIDLIPRLAQLPMPLLALHGRYDWRVPCAEAELVATTALHGRFLLLEDAGHFPFFEKPHDCVEAIRDFALED